MSAKSDKFFLFYSNLFQGPLLSRSSVVMKQKHRDTYTDTWGINPNIYEQIFLEFFDCYNIKIKYTFVRRVQAVLSSEQNLINK